MARKPEHEAAETLSVDGNSSEVAWGGGLGTLVAEGTFGTGTVALQVSIDEGTTWITYTGSGMTSSEVEQFQIGPCMLRANLAGATSPTIRVRIGRIEKPIV